MENFSRDARKSFVKINLCIQYIIQRNLFHPTYQYIYFYNGSYPKLLFAICLPHLLIFLLLQIILYKSAQNLFPLNYCSEISMFSQVTFNIHTFYGLLTALISSTHPFYTIIVSHSMHFKTALSLLLVIPAPKGRPGPLQNPPRSCRSPGRRGGRC
jgi:hypothetical protein